MIAALIYSIKGIIVMFKLHLPLTTHKKKKKKKKQMVYPNIENLFATIINQHPIPVAADLLVENAC